MNHFSRFEKLSWVAAIGAGIGLIMASFYLYGGDDFYRYYLPFAQGCFDCGYVPYFAKWFLFPISFFPEYPFGWSVLTIISVIGFLALAYITRINPLYFFISFPMLGQIWLGQIDVLIATGLVIFLFSKNDYVRGLGLILALTKPQLTFLPLMLSLLLESPRLLPKLLLVPAVTIFLSLIIFGSTWFVDWIENASTNLPVHVWRLASLDVWKFGIFLAPLPLLFKEKRERLTVGLLVSALATPFYGVYSYVLFLLFDIKWWSVLLSYIWMLAFVIWQESAMRLAWILPLGILISMLSSKIKKPSV
ncbi:MAG: hypothetical protein JNM46_01450 [Anaerolineales bacterium]|nr:hypothetical protein [Anaerolineales bacterium]